LSDRTNHSANRRQNRPRRHVRAPCLDSTSERAVAAICNANRGQIVVRKQQLEARFRARTELNKIYADDQIFSFVL
jgi:hypothetical protein